MKCWQCGYDHAPMSGEVECSICGSPHALAGTGLCNSCWEVTTRLPTFIRRGGAKYLKKALKEHSK